MKWYARELGYGAEEEHWGIVGLLHDIDFELYPAEHCLKAPELLREGGVSEDIIHGVVSHGYGITIECGVTLDVEPVHEMEKVLLRFYFPVDLFLAVSHGLHCHSQQFFQRPAKLIGAPLNDLSRTSCCKAFALIFLL